MLEAISVAVVTGGGRGIGRAIARRLREEGMAVVIADVDGAAASGVAEELQGLAFAIDVGDERQLNDMIESVEAQLGPIDLFVSNAGVGYGDGCSGAAAAEGSIGCVADRWDACWRVNVMAHVYAARALIPRMKARGGGFLVNVASAAGVLSQIGDAAYTATKHAAVAFAESLAITHGEEGIHVSVVCPQAVATRMIGIEDDAGTAAGGFGGNDVDGILQPAEVAECIVEGIRQRQFLILPHPQVAGYVRRKAADRDRWISGMQRFRRRLGESG